MLNIAIVGTGIIGNSHIKAIQELQDCRLCALCDVNEEVVAELSSQHNVPYFLDYKQIPGSVDVDAVILNLPHFLHCEASVFFLEHGIHVLVEKPMANTVEECDRMIEAAEKSGKKLAVGHVQRYFPTTQFVVDICASGKLGKLCMYTETRTINYFAENRPKWFLSKEKAGGGIVMNYGAHALDKLFTILGPQDVEITSAVGNIKNDADIEGHAQIVAKFSGGVSAAITFSGYSTSIFDTCYFFENGMVRVRGGIAEVFDASGEMFQADLSQYHQNAMRWQIEEFCKYVNGEDSIVPDGHYGKAVIKAIEQIYA